MSGYGRKSPRDFVQVDELWEADQEWPSYFLGNQVWVYADEYRAELTGDEDYSRILVHAGGNAGWQYRRPLSEKQLVAEILAAIQQPVSQQQLSALGFSPWDGDYHFPAPPDALEISRTPPESDIHSRHP